jgi:hypothetical protein
MHLTNSSLESHNAVADSRESESDGAPENEIEVTPAMCRAGRKEFTKWREPGDDPSTAAFWIFTAMIEASEALGHCRVVDCS